jgi:hypothetical protein
LQLKGGHFLDYIDQHRSSLAQAQASMKQLLSDGQAVIEVAHAGTLRGKFVRTPPIDRPANIIDAGLFASWYGK